MEQKQAPFDEPPGRARTNRSEALGFAVKLIAVPPLFVVAAGAVLYGAFLIAFEQPMGKLLGLALVLAGLFVSVIGWWVALGRPRQWFPPGVNARETMPPHHGPGRGHRSGQR
jgi:hypothetical protein